MKLDHQVKFSLANSFWDANPVNKSQPIAKFQQLFEYPQKGYKEKANVFSFAVFGKDKNNNENLRYRENVKEYTGLVLDIDNDKDNYVSYEEAKKRLQKFLKKHAFIIYTSYSSTPEINRFRIVIFFSEPIRPGILKSIHNYVAEKLKLGDSIDSSGYAVSRPFVFPVCQRGRLSEYKYYINSKATHCFNPKSIPASAIQDESSKVKKKTKNSKITSRFKAETVDLDAHSIDLKTKSLIKSGDASAFNNDRSRLGYRVIKHLIEKGLSTNEIGSVLLDLNYGISERFFDKGSLWTIEDIERIRIDEGTAPAYFPRKKEQDIDDAYAEMERIIKKWLINPVDYRAIQGPAGSGKTEIVIQEVSQSKFNTIEIYVYNHKLAQEYRTRLIDNGMDSYQVEVMRGRTHQQEQGGYLCDRHEVVDKAQRNGIKIYNAFCRNQEGDCEFARNCQYLAQYGIGTKIRIYTHAHLVLTRGGLETNFPDLVIIDESFFDNVIDLNEVNFEWLFDYVKPHDLAKRISYALKNGTPLLGYLRKKFGNKIDVLLTDAIKSLPKTVHAIRPSMSDRDIVSQLNPENKKVQSVKVLLENLQQEIMSYPSRKQSIVARYSGKHIDVANRKDITRFTKTDGNGEEVHAPVLCIDADFCKEIMERIFPGIKSKSFAIRRNAIVTQVHSHTGAKTRLIPRKNAVPDSDEVIESKKQIEETQQFIDCLQAKHNSVLIVTYKEIIDSELFSIPENSEIIHFGGLRGQDKYKDLEAVVIIGRHQIPVNAVENKAACLLWDSEEELELTGEPEWETRGYRLSNDKNIKGVSVMVCKDKRAQLIMEQSRESETLQAIDRIRMIHNTVLKHIYILSNIPLDLDIDRTMHWKDLKKGGERIELLLLNDVDSVFPLSPKYLYENFSDVFKTLSAAKGWVTEFIKSGSTSGKNREFFYSSLLDKTFHLYRYRIEGSSGRPNKALAPINLSPDDVEYQLMNLHGKEIKLKPPFPVLRRFKDLQPHIHENSEYSLEYVEYNEYIKFD